MDVITKESNNRCGGEKEEISLNNVKQVKRTKELSETRSCVQKLKKYTVEYVSKASLHGIQYLGESRTYTEKVWWITSFSISLYLCVSLVLNAYNRWESSPVIVTIATRETPNILIPFPSVTICLETKALPRKFNYTKYYRMLKENLTLDLETERKFGHMSLICSYKSDINYDALKEEYADEEVLDFIDEVSPNFFDMISECKFMGIEERCANLFFPVITDEGLCYTFNLLDRTQILADDVVHYKNYHKAPHLSNWTINGYSHKDPLITYPRRTLFSGSMFALEGKLTTFEDDLDFECGSSVQGYTIDLSQSGRMPRVKQQHFRLPLDQVTVTAVTPDITTTSAAVKNYNPLKRNCYFPEEKSLKYYKVYAQQNCQIECKTNYTLNKCGCVNFYMPRDKRTKFCTGRKLRCIYEAEKELLFMWMKKKLEMIQRGKVVEDICDCPPICTSMDYYVENSQANWDWKKQYDSANGTKHMSYFQVFFKNSQVMTLERNELISTTDFLATVGGILGLCMGFSLLSLIELIYYLTLRAICNIYLYGVKNWSGVSD